VEYEKKVDEALVVDCTSGFGAAETFNPTFEFSMKGAGDIPVALVIGSDGGSGADIADVTDGTGTRIITNVKEMEKNEDFNGWEISGTYWPAAVVA
jgi:hypothetical protein